MGTKHGLTKGPVDRKPTPREREIAQMIAEGLSNLEIGEKLKIATKTVEAHRANLYKKLQVKNTAQLIQIAVASKLVEVKGMKAVKVA